MLLKNQFSQVENLTFFPLTQASVRSSGKNCLGRTTTYHRGGGFRKRFRNVDFSRSIVDIPGFVIRYERDRSRSAYIALVWYSNGFFSYILAPSNLVFNSVIFSGTCAASSNFGDHLSFANITQGSRFFNSQFAPNVKKSFARVAGSSCLLLAKDLKTQQVTIRLPSGEYRRISSLCCSTIGIASNSFHQFKQFRSAGSRRHLGFRPVVRGTAMNPIDHPHGGGQGKTSGGRSSVSPWGVITKGKPTVRKKVSFVSQSHKLLFFFFY